MARATAQCTCDALSSKEFNLWAEGHLREHELHIDNTRRAEELIKDTLDRTALSLDKRLETMNEFRESLKDQSTTFLTKEAYEREHSLLKEKMDEKQYKEFEKFIEGQTVAFNNKGELVVYHCDIEKFLNGEECVD